MAARRIHIIGGSNAGKSTVARNLAQKLNIPAFRLDDLHWDNSAGYVGVRRDPVEKDRELLDIVNRDQWIIEGVYYRWLEKAFRRADLIIILNVPRWRRQSRMIKRFVKAQFGLDEPQESGLIDLWHTLRWNHRYDTSYLPATREFLRNLAIGWVECRSADDVYRAVVDVS